MTSSEQRITDTLARLAIELRHRNRQTDADAVLAGRSAIQARATILAFTARYGLSPAPGPPPSPPIA